MLELKVLKSDQNAEVLFCKSGLKKPLESFSVSSSEETNVKTPVKANLCAKNTYKRVTENLLNYSHILQLKLVENEDCYLYFFHCSFHPCSW